MKRRRAAAFGCPLAEAKPSGFEGKKYGEAGLWFGQVEGDWIVMNCRVRMGGRVVDGLTGDGMVISFGDNGAPGWKLRFVKGKVRW
ncbi:hypothetical protein HPP92_017442 [Vanilla planifolia]|uniref:Uncharacterized protein n=1 Tax=Vanilla planifolia TaxID=51239 RepID=A0A835QN50_VANPL|nr:hypothetical protein HPP92_017442 [Vanilla planifolia]